MTTTNADKFFIPFSPAVQDYSLPASFILQDSPHPLAIRAAEDLKQYLKTQKDWEHNFGLIPAQEGKVIGKMFGVLVVKTLQNKIAYLAAFSGKLANSNQHAKFVPPVFDGLCEQSFVNEGMCELSGTRPVVQENVQARNFFSLHFSIKWYRLLSLNSGGVYLLNLPNGNMAIFTHAARKNAGPYLHICLRYLNKLKI